MTTDRGDTVTTKWHWIVCFAVPFATILEASLPHSFGTFIAHFQSTTRLKLTELIWITATTSAIPCIFLPLFVLIIKKYRKFYRQFGVLSFVTMSCSCLSSSAIQSVRWMYLTYTLIYGVSSAILLAVCVIILSEYFPVLHPYHVLASSLYQIGYPVAASAFSPFMAYLITKLDWHHALQILAGIQLILGCSTAMLFRPKEDEGENKHLLASSTGPMWEDRSSPSENGDKESQAVSESYKDGDSSVPQTISCCEVKQLILRPQMFTWFFAKFLNYICWFSMRTNLTPFLYWRGHSLTQSALVMTTYALGEISLCVVAAFVSRFLRRKLLAVHILGSVGMATLMLSWSSLPSNYVLELTVAFFIGIFVQITLNFGYPASVEVLGLDMSVSWTVTNVFAGMGILISPVLGGVTFDSTKSFLVFFYIIGGLWVLQLILYLITAAILRFCTFQYEKVA